MVDICVEPMPKKISATFSEWSIVVRFLPLVIDHNHGYKSLPW